MPNLAKQQDLLVANTTVVAGQWVDVRQYDNIVISVRGMVANDVVKIEGSCEAVPTAVQLGASVTADGFYTPSGNPLWIRANRTAITGGGTVYVSMLAQ